MGKPAPAKTRSEGESRSARLTSSVNTLMAVGGIFAVGVLVGVVGPRQWLPASIRGEDPEIRSLEDRLELKDVQIGSLEAQVDLFKGVAESTRQQNESVLDALKQSNAGAIDLQKRVESERDAKARAEARAEKAKADLRTLENTAPDLESLGLWANGRPTASARALARTAVLPAEGQRSSLVEALGPQNRAIEIQKELVMLLHRETETQARCQKLEAAQNKAWENMSVPFPVCSPATNPRECDQLTTKWDEDLKAQDRKYSEASNEFTACQLDQVGADAALMEAISAADPSARVTASK